MPIGSPRTSPSSTGPRGRLPRSAAGSAVRRAPRSSSVSTVTRTRASPSSRRGPIPSWARPTSCSRPSMSWRARWRRRLGARPSSRTSRRPPARVSWTASRSPRRRPVCRRAPWPSTRSPELVCRSGWLTTCLAVTGPAPSWPSRGTISYRLRDWVFSRQRYWGEPIPIYFPVELADPTGDPRRGAAHTIRYDQPLAVDESELPLRLPELADYNPGEDPAGPLARVGDWRFFQRDGRWFARETNTMPQWAGSCWYYLRFLDPGDDDKPWAMDAYDAWMPVDLYVGGAEHAVLHERLGVPDVT